MAVTTGMPKAIFPGVVSTAKAEKLLELTCGAACQGLSVWVGLIVLAELSPAAGWADRGTRIVSINSAISLNLEITLVTQVNAQYSYE